MSEAMKPTPGEWQLWTSCSWRRIMTTDGAPIAVPTIARDGHPDLNISKDDARLIAEAGTVFHETGLSPRQLLEQRAELLAACQKMAEWEACEKDYSIGFMERIDLCNEAFNMMRAAIAKCEVKQ